MLSQVEFDEIIQDESKRIEGNISWDDSNHASYVGFRASITSPNGYPLFVKGSYNQAINALTYALIHQGHGRIYALDMGKDHRNPDGQLVGEKHKHTWRESTRDKFAYVPADITASASDPVEVWHQFCEEAKIIHDGNLASPPIWQPNLFL